MCIRDRSYTIFTLPFTVWVLTPFMRDLPVEIEEAAIVDGATPWIIITKVFLPLLWPCLLYTSDAADERSSVDLGGRRIIKKKKKEDNNENNVSIITQHTNT